MSEQSAKGISRDGSSDAIHTDEQHKSRLLVEARLLRDQKQHAAAADKFAEAAEVEEQLSQACADGGLHEKSFVHQFSAVSLWAQAGNFYQALALCDRMLARTDLPQRLRGRVEHYGNTLRSRRDQWYGELVVQSAPGEAPV
jgi:hypothetical protein